MEADASTQADIADLLTVSKKPAKKKKLTPAEKALAQLDKDAQTVKSNGEVFGGFVDRLERWLEMNHEKAVELFRKVDISGEGIVSVDEFKAGMLDLLIPCPAVELHLLASILDENKIGHINFVDLAKTMNIVRERELNHTQSDLRPLIREDKPSLEQCATCKMVKWDGENYKQKYLRFVEIDFVLLKFSHFRRHPGHVRMLLHSHETVYSVMDALMRKNNIHTSQMFLSTDKSMEASYILPPEKTLEESGLVGGPKNVPQSEVIFYDYKIDITDCSLLLCDHYFGKKVSVA